MQHDYNGFPNQRIARTIAARFPRNARVLVHRDMDLLVPIFGTEGAYVLTPNPSAGRVAITEGEPVLRDLHTAWDIAKHAQARKPVTLGVVGPDIRASFPQPLAEWTRHVLDMPIKFPGTDVRVPAALASVVPAIQRILDVEAGLNSHHDEYYAYLSVHQADLKAGERMRENPYHV
ncbi:MAG: hypothetical protein Q8R16_01705, partial [bacterium]|nr:hypothetical protein [bacterium]